MEVLQFQYRPMSAYIEIIIHVKNLFRCGMNEQLTLIVILDLGERRRVSVMPFMGQNCSFDEFQLQP